MNEFIEKFDLKEYTKFFKEAFKKADLIAIDLDCKIDDILRLSKGKYSFIRQCMIGTETHYENHFPYTKVILEKKYEVYEYLSKIDNWEDFSAYDEEVDLSIRGVDFIKDGELIAFIVSHYRDYCSHFGWI